MVLIVSMAVGCGAKSPPGATDPRACPALRELRGRVVEENAGVPVPSAEVVATGQGRVWERTATTDDEGAFRICVPASDAVEVRAAHPDFGLQWTSLRGLGHRYWDAMPDAPLQLALRRGTILRGRLLDPEGRPLPDHVVLVFLPPELQTCMTSVCRHVRAVTDMNGEFRFDRMLLDPGMQLAWSLPGAPAWQLGGLVEPRMAAYIAAANAGQPVALVVSSGDLDEEFREIIEEASEASESESVE